MPIIFQTRIQENFQVPLFSLSRTERERERGEKIDCELVQYLYTVQKQVSVEKSPKNKSRIRSRGPLGKERDAL